LITQTVPIEQRWIAVEERFEQRGEFDHTIQRIGHAMAARMPSSDAAANASISRRVLPEPGAALDEQRPTRHRTVAVRVAPDGVERAVPTSQLGDPDHAVASISNLDIRQQGPVTFCQN